MSVCGSTWHGPRDLFRVSHGRSTSWNMARLAFYRLCDRSKSHRLLRSQLGPVPRPCRRAETSRPAGHERQQRGDTGPAEAYYGRRAEQLLPEACELCDITMNLSNTRRLTPTYRPVPVASAYPPWRPAAYPATAIQKSKAHGFEGIRPVDR